MRLAPYVQIFTRHSSQNHPDRIGPLSTVKVDGTLTIEEVEEVRRVCQEVKERVVLDRTDLQFADREGVSALPELRAHGAKLTGVSPYLRLLLNKR